MNALVVLDKVGYENKMKGKLKSRLQKIHGRTQFVERVKKSSESANQSQKTTNWKLLIHITQDETGQVDDNAKIETVPD